MNRHPRVFASAVLLALLLSNLPWLGQAAPPAQEEITDLHGRPAFAGETAFMRTDSVPRPAVESTEAVLVPASRIIFQSARNNNDWEVYAANDDGSDEARLTDHVSADVQPRLNRGCTRAVFSSKRTGTTYEIWTSNPDGSGMVRVTENTFNDLSPAWSPDGTKIAFASDRDGQPEIYVMNADGSNPTRLTWDADYDDMPAWSPDGTRIAFVSRRTGGYRIWAMGANGSNATMLSAQPYSFDPAWSPDGSRIAFDADGNGDGWLDIWLMNADGSNQTQVRTPSYPNGDNWVRSWSPDGRYVAFTEIAYINYGGNWYWTAAYLSAWNSSSGAVYYLGVRDTEWYPDWQSTDGQAPTSNVLALPAESPASFPVSWQGADGGTAGLRNYDIQVRDGAGPWTDWLTATVAISATYTGEGRHTYYFRSRARDNAYNVEPWPAAPDGDAATTVEGMPPDTAVDPLPRYYRSVYVEVSWGGMDLGGSGIAGYDVQYQDTAIGTWAGWLTGTLETAWQFNGTPGHTYAFRCRATDLAANREAWPAGQGDTATTVYVWAIAGTAEDNRGTLLPGVVVDTLPPAFENHPSDAHGAYSAYLAAEVASTTWTRTGYGVLPDTWFGSGQDAHVDVVMPPVDNVVQNWGFEDGTAYWTPGGVITPGIVIDARHTGGYGAALGCQSPGFAPAQDLSNNWLSTYGAQMQVSELGDIHVVWQNSLGITGTIYYAHQPPAGGWEAPRRLSDPADGDIAYAPSIIVDGAGVLHALWSQQAAGDLHLFYARRATNGAWSDPLMVSTEGSDQPPQLAVEENGTLHVVWAWSNVLYHARRAAGGDWSGPTAISTGVPGAYAPSMQQGADGVLHVVFYGSDAYGIGRVDHVHRATDGTWSTPVQIVDMPTPISGLTSALDSAGKLHVAWREDVWGPGDISYRYRDTAGSWSTPENVTADDPVSDSPVLAAGAGGLVHLAWLKGSGGEAELVYAERAAGGAWSAPLTLSLSLYAGLPQMALHDDGTLHLVWAEWGGSPQGLAHVRRNADRSWEEAQIISLQAPHEQPRLTTNSGAVHTAWAGSDSYGTDIYYMRTAGSDATGDSFFAQAVTVPLTMTAPTLSFLYRLEGASPASGSWFDVTLHDGLSSTTLLSTTTRTDDWAHGWLDLTAWASRTVTVTFNVYQTAGPFCSWVYLDEVSLGAAYPDLWVAKRGPSAAPAGETVVYTLSYGNRGGADAAGVVLTDTLPAEVTFITASVAPVTTTLPLRWEVGEVAAGAGPFQIVVTATITPTVRLGSTLTNTAIIAGAVELETANNTATSATFIGYRIYLPVVRR